MNINLTQEDINDLKTPLLVLVYSKEQIVQLKKEHPTDGLPGEISLLLADFKGEKNEVMLQYSKGNAQRLCLVGLGEEANITLQTIRKALGNIVNIAKKKQVREYVISAQHTFALPLEQYIKAIAETSILSHYDWDKYKTKKEDHPKPVHAITVVINSDPKPLQKMIHETQLICEQTLFVRDCVNENADVMTPLMLEKLSRETARAYKLKINVLDQKQMQKLQMNLILGVAQGSSYPPRMIFLEYSGNKKSKEKIALVGKGITFDTGGLNLKPTRFIETMKCDMAGAATVLGIIRAASALKLQVNLVAVLSCAENSIGSTAQKPGDVIKAYNGTTVEITNTDAEGRLVLADALSYVQEKYKPTTIIDLATLTGAVMSMFGYVAAGVMGTDQKLIDTIVTSGDKTYELACPIPLYDEFEEQLKSTIADTISCVITPYGGTITAALFLKKFVTIKSWAHLDMAGTAFLEKAGSAQGLSGATGYGVRLIIETLKQYKA